MVVKRRPRIRGAPAARTLRLLTGEVTGAVVDPDEEIQALSPTDDIEVAVRVDVGHHDRKDPDAVIRGRQDETGCESRGRDMR